MKHGVLRPNSWLWFFCNAGLADFFFFYKYLQTLLFFIRRLNDEISFPWLVRSWKSHSNFFFFPLKFSFNHYFPCHQPLRIPQHGWEFGIHLCVLPVAAEIQHCLVTAGDVGCGVFECFENNSCEIRGLHAICMSFLHNAGKFDAQVKTAQSPKNVLGCHNVIDMSHGKTP